ncbi:uncharacterized protein LOC115889620 isoform X1 [Sitophilus oryzae]|uniref:Uncharacterized protein LOC115889620 isoform X1 n=1 Tax=Sitophilus oryzae TaxID=7048 RepID=A0A6J2YQH6_SITOR|nr:uncharacterized protein LOC115889620 isoform X1 [Sitophilus oryzae]
MDFIVDMTNKIKEFFIPKMESTESTFAPQKLSPITFEITAKAFTQQMKRNSSVGDIIPIQPAEEVNKIISQIINTFNSDANFADGPKKPLIPMATTPITTMRTVQTNITKAVFNASKQISQIINTFNSDANVADGPKKPLIPMATTPITTMRTVQNNITKAVFNATEQMSKNKKETGFFNAYIIAAVVLIVLSVICLTGTVIHKSRALKKLKNSNGKYNVSQGKNNFKNNELQDKSKKLKNIP